MRADARDHPEGRLRSRRSFQYDEAGRDAGRRVPPVRLLAGAIGRISGTCIAARRFDARDLIDADKRAELRRDLRFLTATAKVDSTAPADDDITYTVRDGLFDLDDSMHACDRGLEAELQHALDDLP